MNPVVQNNETLLAILNELVAAGNYYNGAKLMLFQNNISLGPTMVLADLTAADFTGYALSSAVTWGAAFLAPGNVPTVAGDLKLFVAASPFTTANTVYGWALVDGAGTTLILARKFDTPISIAAALQAVSVLPAVPAFLPE